MSAKQISKILNIGRMFAKEKKTGMTQSASGAAAVTLIPLVNVYLESGLTGVLADTVGLSAFGGSLVVLIARLIYKKLAK